MHGKQLRDMWCMNNGRNVLITFAYAYRLLLYCFPLKYTTETQVAYFPYPHWWGYPWFHCYKVCLSNCSLIRWCMIETSSGLPHKSSTIFGNLRASSEIFGKCSATFVWPSDKFLRIFGNHSESGRKSSENRQKPHHQDVYIILKHHTLAWRCVLVAKTNIVLATQT